MNSDSPRGLEEGQIAIAGHPKQTGGFGTDNNLPVTPRADVGVLLVHGIGKHREGETLRAFGQPLLDWLKDWLRGKGGTESRGRVVVSEARFNDAQAPAHALAQVTGPSLKEPEKSQQESWLLCEGWWGATVQPPASFQLLRWMWSRGPLLIYWHFYIRQTVDRAKTKPTLMDILFFAVAVSLAGSCQIVVGIAMLLSLIPIGPWRRKIIDAVRAITLTLGDSYVLEEDIQRAALVDRVRRALDWLAKRTDQIVVIAHSQGGAIAHDVLRQNASNTAMFITVGSGLEKLHFLREVVIGKKGLIMASLLFPLIFTAGIIAWSTPEHWARGLAGLMTFGALVCITALAVELDSYRKQLGDAVPELELRSLGSKRWVDIYASDDVVPMDRGSLLTTANFLDRRKVYNERSYIRDHLAYFTNVNDCLPVMWQNLAHLSRLAIFKAGDEQRLLNFASIHKWYAHVISFSRLALFIAVFLAGYVLRNSLLGFGHSVLTAMDGTIVGDWLKPVRGFAGILAAVIKRFVKADSITPDVLAEALFGALILIVIIAVWWTIFRAFWLSRCQARWRKACQGQDVPQSGMARILTLAAGLGFLCFGCLPLIISIILAIRPDYFTVERLGNVVAMALAALALLLAMLIAAAGPLAAESSWQDPKQPWLQRLLSPIILLLPIGAALTLVEWLWPGFNPTLKAAVSSIFLLVVAVSWQVFAVVRIRKHSRSMWVVAIVAIPMVGAGATLLWRFASPHSMAVLAYDALTAAVLIATLLVHRTKTKEA